VNYCHDINAGTQVLAVECLKWREIAKNEKNPKCIGPYIRTYIFFSFLAISRHFKHSTLWPIRHYTGTRPSG